jgi:hypothetical protein
VTPDLALLWSLPDAALEDGVRSRSRVLGSKEADGLRLEEFDFLGQMALGAKARSFLDGGGSSATRTHFGRVQEEETGVEKGLRTGLTTYAVSEDQLGIVYAIDGMKEAEA